MEKKMLLEVKHIDKSFGITKALKDVSFQIYAGEVRGLIGENGSGKSTVSSIISGIQKADRGEMIYEGKTYLPENILEQSSYLYDCAGTEYSDNHFCCGKYFYWQRADVFQRRNCGQKENGAGGSESVG